MGERQRCAGREGGDRKDVWRVVCAENEKGEGDGEDSCRIDGDLWFVEGKTSAEIEKVGDGGVGSCGIGGKVKDVVGKVLAGERFLFF